jgi:predicted DNA-binding ribbon-helix-helix protein
MELLALLRVNPGVDGIRNLVQFVEDERADYYNLGKAVRSIMVRALTEEEEQLVKRLGANA